MDRLGRSPLEIMNNGSDTDTEVAFQTTTTITDQSVDFQVFRAFSPSWLVPTKLLLISIIM